jgi:hypothetical protein
MSPGEYADLVRTVGETIEQVLPTDPQMNPDHDQTPHAAFAGGPVHAYVLDVEKIVWHFPDASERLIEDTP